MLWFEAQNLHFFIKSLSFVCSASLNTKFPVCTSSTPLYGSLVTSLVKRKMFSLHASVRTSLPRSKTSTAARLMTRCVCFSCPCNQMVKVLSRHLKKKSICLFSIFNVGLQSKIVRVLNLWQKNNVFKSDIIQPLLDMAAGLPPPSVMPISASSAVPINSTTPGKIFTHNASSVKQYTVVATCFLFVILGLH